MNTMPAAIMLFAVFAFSGCFPSDVLNKANETNAFACLKMISTAQMIFFSDQEQFMPSFDDLDKKGYGSERTLKQMVAARYDLQNRAAFSGYYFADIRKESDGSPLNNRSKYGLVAYPAKPGKDTKVFLLLMDMGKAVVRETGPSTSGEEIQYWIVSAADLNTILDRWPTDDELNATFHRKLLTTPSEYTGVRSLIFDFLILF